LSHIYNYKMVKNNKSKRMTKKFIKKQEDECEFMFDTFKYYWFNKQYLEEFEKNLISMKSQINVEYL